MGVLRTAETLTKCLRDELIKRELAILHQLIADENEAGGVHVGRDGQLPERHRGFGNLRILAQD